MISEQNVDECVRSSVESYAAHQYFPSVVTELSRKVVNRDAFYSRLLVFVPSLCLSFLYEWLMSVSFTECQVTIVCAVLGLHNFRNLFFV